MPPRPALLVLNQYYAPGQESTAQLLTELCEALAADYEVTVVTGTVYHAPKPERTIRNGVTSSASGRRRSTAASSRCGASTTSASSC